jgi:hypothetical protein
MPEFHYPYTGEDDDQSMKFESLIIHAFEGQHKWDDPLGFGAQDLYRNPIEVPRAALMSAFGAMAYRFKNNLSDEHKEELRELALETREVTEWPQLASIIDKGLALYHQL